MLNRMSTTRRRTAATLASEMMPGPRLTMARPTVPRFTFRKQVTVAPRNIRKQTLRVRKTAANLAKTIRQIPSVIKGYETMEANFMAELQGLREQYGSVNTRFSSNQIRKTTKIRLTSRIRRLGTSLREIRKTLVELRKTKHRINTYKVPSLTVRTVGAPNLIAEEVGTTPRVNLPGIVEEENGNNE